MCFVTLKSLEGDEMEGYFRDLATNLFGALQGQEVLLLNYEG